MERVNIICIYWQGDFRGRDYTLEDIERLRLSVERHIHIPYTFYCLTNVVERLKTLPEVVALPLCHPWPGWWAKMELHRPDLPAGRTLYLDLDSHVVGDLQPILDYEGDLVMFPSPYRHIYPLVKKKEWEVIYRYQAATMLFTPGKQEWFYDKFREDPDKYMRKYRSEQDLMGLYMPDLNTFPTRWMKKLRECRDMTSAPNKDVIIVTGRPGDGSFRDMGQYPWVERTAHGV